MIEYVRERVRDRKPLTPSNDRKQETLYHKDVQRVFS